MDIPLGLWSLRCATELQTQIWLVSAVRFQVHLDDGWRLGYRPGETKHFPSPNYTPQNYIDRFHGFLCPVPGIRWCIVIFLILFHCDHQISKAFRAGSSANFYLTCNSRQYKRVVKWIKNSIMFPNFRSCFHHIMSLTHTWLCFWRSQFLHLLTRVSKWAKRTVSSRLNILFFVI